MLLSNTPEKYSIVSRTIVSILKLNRMNINVSSAAGHGLTELSAFDAALSKLGVRDQNLIHLSSVIPLGGKIVRKKIDYNNKYQGDRLYCVYAEKRTDTRGESVSAGLGWVITREEPFWGLFVEHSGHTVEEVSTQIHSSLKSMMQYRSEYNWSEIQEEIVTVTCETKPVCAMSLAVYHREDW